MSTAEIKATPPIPDADDDPFRYGWRYVHVPRPDGTTAFEQVPLTVEDLLHPQEEDFRVHTQLHNADCAYLMAVFEARLAEFPDAVVLSDVRVDWDVPGLKAHGPDVVVFRGVPPEKQAEWRSLGTWHVRREGIAPALVVEVVSPIDREVRDNDVVIKVKHYHRAGVPLYVIVDDLGRDGRRRLRLVGYRWEPKGYVWLEPVRMWLGIVGDRVACYDPDTNREIGDYTQITRELAEVQARATALAETAAEERARADELGRLVTGQTETIEAQTRALEKAVTIGEDQARLMAEKDERIRQLEEEIRRRESGS